MKIFVISGPSGTGKTTILEKLMVRPGMKGSFLRVITATTRKPRPGEKHAKDYYFYSQEEFKRKEKEGYFIETKRFSENWYGTPKHNVGQAKKEHKDIVFCIDVDGARKIRALFPRESVLTFIHPPHEEALMARLAGRGTESEAVLKKRLRIAKTEVKYAHCYDYGIVNDDLESAVDQLQSIIIAERVKQ